MALLIPDSGPLFSLAAGGLLGILDHFHWVLTDMVKMEAVDPGGRPGASSEALAIHAFCEARAASVEVFETQVGRDWRAMRKADPDRPAPPHLGELSIQSLLIHLQVVGGEAPVVLFEDSWFLRHAQALAKPCIVVSTEAFLINAERLGLIPSAETARAAIAALRPTAYPGKVETANAPAPRTTRKR